MLYVGGGVIKAGAHAELLALAELAQAPVTTTLMARGAFPDPHPLALGMPGMHGCYTAVAALQEADLVVALGARFDDRVTGNLATFAPHAKIVHADIDPAEIGKNRVPDVPIPGDVRATLAGLTESMAALIAENGPPDTGYWLRCIGDWKRRFPLRYTQDADGPLKPQHVVERLSALTGGEAVVVAGVGQHQMHAAQHYSFTTPRSWINSGGLGTMGFAVPAAMGAQVGRPGELVVAIDGDGCFQMTAQELATCAIEHLPIKVLIFNNGFLGMVRQWQELFYEERYSEVELGTAIPDYVKLAEAYGVHRGRAARSDPPGAARRADQEHGGAGPVSTHTLSVLVENKPGVLAHVAGLFSRRAFNISSLAVGPTEDPKVSRMTIVVDGASTPVEQVAKQLDKLVRVLKVVELDDHAAVERELALIKVRIDPALRGELLEVATVFHTKVVDMSPETVILEATSSPGKLDSLLENLERYGTCELVRTGRIAMSRGSGTITDNDLAPLAEAV